MSYQSYYDKLKYELQRHWVRESFFTSQYNSASMLGNRVGMEPFKFGLIIWDWDEQYAKRLRQLKYQNYENLMDEDPYKYKKWPSGSAGREDFYGIPFQFIEHPPIWTKSANWSDISDIMGRFESQSIYASTGPNDMTLTLIYYATSSKGSDLELTSPFNSSYIGQWTLGAIDRFVLQLQSLVFPQYDGLYGPPVKCLLNIGNIFVDFPVIIKTVTVEQNEPYEVTTMRSMMRKVTLEMRSSYPSWQAIGATQVWTSDGNGVFARQELQPLG